MHVDGKQYAVPFDTHPIVLYYNKDKLAAAGLIGANGLPTGLNGADNFIAALEEAQGRRQQMGHLDSYGGWQLRAIERSIRCSASRTARPAATGKVSRRQPGEIGQGVGTIAESG